MRPQTQEIHVALGHLKPSGGYGIRPYNRIKTPRQTPIYRNTPHRVMRNRYGYGYASIGRGHCPLNPNLTDRRKLTPAYAIP